MENLKMVEHVNGAGDQAPKLKFLEKFSTQIPGGFGTFYHQTIQLFSLFFYTDVMKLNPAFVAALFVVTSVITAIATPAFGIFFDRVNTPWGKYKPWFIICFVGAAIMGFFTFTNFSLNSAAQYIYASVTYVLLNLFLAVMQGPGGGVGPAITKRVDDRVSIGQIGYFVTMFGVMLAQVGVLPLYKALGKGNVGQGFSRLMMSVLIIAVLGAVMMSVKIKERYIVEKPKSEKGPSLLVVLKTLLTNKYAIICYVYILAINLSTGIKTAVSLYYFKYYFHFDSLLSIAGAISMLPVMIGVLFSSKLTKKIGVKKNVLIFAVVNVVTLALNIILPPNQIGIVLYIVFLCISGFFSGISMPAQSSMMPAAMDYTEWKTGLNINSFMGSFSGLLQAISTALAGSVAAGCLAIFGYNADSVQQNGATIMGFRLLMSIIPAIIAALVLTVSAFDLDEKKQAQISQDLAERRQANKN